MSLYDRLHVFTSTSGTGPYTVTGAATNRLSVDQALDAAGVTKAGAILELWVLPDDSAGSDDFEHGLYTYDGTSQLTRTRVIRSSNGDAAVNWGATQRNIVSAPSAALLNRLFDTVNCGLAGGTANALSLSPNMPIHERKVGRLYLTIAAYTNTGPATADPSTLGIDDIKLHGNALAGGEIIAGNLIGLLDEGTDFALIQIEAPSDLPGAVVFSGQITPAQITADQNNYAPADSGDATKTWSLAAGARISADAPRVITGLAGGRAGRRVWLRNDGDHEITLSDANAGSSAANRFGFGLDYRLQPGERIELEYDGTDAVWRIVATSRRRAPVRQTVLSGPVDSNGLPNFGGSTGSTTVTASGTIVCAAANGIDAGGAVDTVFAITNPSWTGLNSGGDGVKYLYVQKGGGAPTVGFSATRPNYQFGGSYSTTNGQFTFNTQEMIGKVGDGSAASQVNRVYVGQVTVSGGVVTDIRWYALMGRYEGAFTNTLPSTNTPASANHNIGVKDLIACFEIECLTAEQDYAIGDRVQIQGSYSATSGIALPLMFRCNESVIALRTMSSQAFTLVNSSGNSFPATAANWKYRFVARRRW